MDKTNKDMQESGTDIYLDMNESESRLVRKRDDETYSTESLSG